MECKGIKNQLSDYIDGQLPETAAAVVAHHLASCPDCKQAHEDMTRLVGLMREIDTVDEPADLLQNVRSRLESKPPVWDRIRDLLSTPAFRVPAAATVLAAVLLFVLYVPGEREIPLMSPAPVMEEKSADGFFDREVTLEQEKKGPERQKLDDETEELAEVAGETEPIAERGGRDEEVAVQVVEGDELKRGRSNEDVKPAAPKSEAVDELRSQDAAVPAPAEEAPEVASEPVATMDEDAAAGLASPKKSAVKLKELSTDTAFITLKKGDDLVEFDLDKYYDKKNRFTVAFELSREDSLAEAKRVHELVELTQEQMFVHFVIDSIGGEVTRWEYDDERRWTATLANIPADRFEDLRTKLADLGEVTFALKPVTAKEQQPLTVKIRILR